MANSTLPDGYITVTRDDDFRGFLKAFKIRAPGIAATQDTYPWIHANVAADVNVAIHGNAARIADTNDLESYSGARLEALATTVGLTPARIVAVGGTGAVVIAASVGGGTIVQGDQLKDKVTGLKFQVTSSTQVFLDGSDCSIGGIDVGPPTNLAAGTVLTWTSPRPGIGPTVTVAEQTDGTGLSGGREKETDSQLRDRIRDFRQTRPANGNSAQVRELMRKPETGVFVQEAFMIPGVLGTGTGALVFTLAPSFPGGSRAPNSTQRADVLTFVMEQMPGDTGLFMSTLTGVSTDIVFRVDWQKGAIGWKDLVTWPPYDAINPYTVSALTTPTATIFRIKTSAGSPLSPQVGQTVAVYDRPNSLFRAKRIGAIAVNGAGDWTITVNTTNNVSDITYAPIAGQTVSPWSDSLQLLALPITNYFDTLGPGEQWGGSDRFDAGERRIREPESPSVWPSELTTKIEVSVASQEAVSNAQMVSPTLPHPCPVGTPGINSNILELGNIAVFPL